MIFVNKDSKFIFSVSDDIPWVIEIGPVTDEFKESVGIFLKVGEEIDSFGDGRLIGVYDTLSDAEAVMAKITKILKSNTKYVTV